MNWLSLLVPFTYLGTLLISLATFSSLYRKRKAQKSLSLAPYFAPNQPRNIYLSLLHLQDHDPSAAKVPDSLLRAALLARCTENIHRIIHVRTRKQALNTLLKRGCIGDELWQRLLRAEKEVEADVKDCIQEANAFSPNWGLTIFQSANEMANNDMMKKRLDGIFTTLPEEKKAWEARRQALREGFMRELEGKGGGAKVASLFPSAAAADDDTVEGRKESAAKGSSEEDGVIVEKGGDAAAVVSNTGGAGSGAAGGGGGGKGKKKKGKR